MTRAYSEAELDTVLTVRMMRRAGACVRAGQMPWFARYGFDFKTVMKDGVPVRDIVAIGDGFGLAVVNRILAKEPLHGAE